MKGQNKIKVDSRRELPLLLAWLPDGQATTLKPERLNSERSTNCSWKRRRQSAEKSSKQPSSLKRADQQTSCCCSDPDVEVKARSCGVKELARVPEARS